MYFTRDYKFQAIIGKWFKEGLNNSKSMGSKNLLTTGSVVSSRGRLCGKIRYRSGKITYRSRVHILNYILPCCILMPCLGAKIQPQLSEYPSYIEEMLHYLMFVF